MKKIILITTIIVISIFHISCNNESPEVMDDLSEIRLTLEKHVIANEKKDIELIKEIWAPSEKIIIFGTNSDEKIVGRSQIIKSFELQFQLFDQAYLSISEQSIHLNKNKDVAWFSQHMDYNYTIVSDDRPRRFEGVRFTGVLEKIDNRWYIVQSHLSIPYPTMEKSKN